jgi:hypothetical protein
MKFMNSPYFPLVSKAEGAFRGGNTASHAALCDRKPRVSSEYFILTHLVRGNGADNLHELNQSRLAERSPNHV